MSNIQPLPFKRPAMLNYVEAVDEPFDVVVIGGGATGVYVALDSASRGYRTALFERGDFASGTSSRSTKLIHGGVRYMQQGRLLLVRESLRERHLFIQNAPHLVTALPVLVPAYSRWQRFKYTAGVIGYNAVSQGHRLGRTGRLGREDAVSAVPGIQREGLHGGTTYLDGQTDDARLALAIARTAAAYGSAVINYAKVRALRTSRGRVTGVEVEDRLTGESLSLDAKVVINATGAYTDQTLALDPGGRSGLMRWSRGTHIVMPRPLLGDKHGLLVPQTSDGRVIYALPWLSGTLIGTTDVPVDSPDIDDTPPAEEVEFLVGEIGKFLPEAKGCNILSAFSGIRPLVSNDASPSTSSISRTHRIIVSDSGLVTITGGKWTTARLMAEHTLARAAEVGGLAAGQCATDRLHLHGFLRTGNAEGYVDEPVEDPDSLYGTDVAEVKDLERRWPGLSSPLGEGLPYRLSHAVFASRQEMAQSLEDVLARRTRALFLNVDAAVAGAEEAARAIEEHGGVERGWAERELKKFPEVASRFRAGKSG